MVESALISLAYRCESTNISTPSIDPPVIISKTLWHRGLCDTPSIPSIAIRLGLSTTTRSLQWKQFSVMLVIIVTVVRLAARLKAVGRVITVERVARYAHSVRAARWVALGLTVNPEKNGTRRQRTSNRLMREARMRAPAWTKRGWRR
jgi:hypothetical protein